MPHIVELPHGDLPVSLDAVRRAFGSLLRLRLIRHYLDQPGSQKDAAEALGLATSVIQLNTEVLVETRVVVCEKRGYYSVDHARLDELRAELGRYFS